MKRVGYAWIPLSIGVFWIAASTGMRFKTVSFEIILFRSLILGKKIWSMMC